MRNDSAHDYKTEGTWRFVWLQFNLFEQDCTFPDMNLPTAIFSATAATAIVAAATRWSRFPPVHQRV